MTSHETWAYRASKKDPLVEVSIVAEGTERPPRTLIRHLSTDSEGREEWVPPTRLKVVWSEVDEYREREKRWEALADASLDRDDPRADAAETVRELLIDSEIATDTYPIGGGLHVLDPIRLANLLDLDESVLTSHPTSFIEDGSILIPWEGAESLIRRAVKLNPDPIIKFIRKEENEARHQAIHGDLRSLSRYRSPEECIEFDEQYHKPQRDLLLSWCDASATERVDEISELRREIRRVFNIANSAIRSLDAAKDHETASKLETELNTTVESLRTPIADSTIE